MKKSLNDPPKPTKPTKPYDWARDPIDDDIWGAPMSAPEHAFWRGVWIGAITEGVVLVMIAFVYWWLL